MVGSRNHPLNFRGRWRRPHIPTRGEKALSGLGRPRAPVIVENPRVVGDAWSGRLRSYRWLVEVGMEIDVVRRDKLPVDLNGWWRRPHIPTRGEEALGGWCWLSASAQDSQNPPHTSRQ